MPLNSLILNTAVNTFFDPQSNVFIRFPENIQDCAEKWGNAIRRYTRLMIPKSNTHTLAKSAFVAQLIMATTPGAFKIVFPQALMVYATTLVPGMLPNFIGVPPTTPIIMDDIWALGMSGASARELSILITTRIDTWFRTGVYSIVTPTGPVFAGPWL